MEFEFSGEIWYWRGPAPFYFVSVPPAESREIKSLSPMVTYGWGVIPVRARIGGTTYTTSLFPKDGLYALPVKVAVRRAESLDEGDTVRVRMQLG